MTAISESRIKQAEYVRNIWTINPELGTSVEDMLKEQYWAHVAPKLKAWDKIEVRAEDGEFYAEFLVLDAGRTWAKVVLVVKIELEKPSIADIIVDKEYVAQFKGPQRRWCVLRLKDKTIIKENLFPKEEALKWIVEHNKAMGK